VEEFLGRRVQSGRRERLVDLLALLGAAEAVAGEEFADGLQAGILGSGAGGRSREDY
jgi:hypothetical protein